MRLCLLLLCAAAVPAAAADAALCAQRVGPEGLDVSRWDGAVDWAQVKASGRVFAYASAAAGTQKDPAFEGHWQAMKAAGLLRGASLRFYPSQDVATQAKLLIDAVGTPQPQDLPPMVGVEDADGLSATTVNQRLHQLMDGVKSATGLTPVLYTGAAFWNDSLKSDHFGTHPLALASFAAGCPTPPTGWLRWAFHPYSLTGAVAGVTGNVALWRFAGTRAELDALATGKPLPDPATPPGGATARNDDGRLEVFARSVDGALWHAAQTRPLGTWGPFESLGGELLLTPAVAPLPGGDMHLLAHAVEGDAVVFSDRKAGTWAPWAPLFGGRLFDRPTLLANADGTLQTFVRGLSSEFFHAHRSAGGWEPWKSVGGGFSSNPVLAQNQDGRLDAFGRGSGGDLWHTSQLAPGGDWSQLFPLPGGLVTLGAPAVARNADGRLQLAARAADYGSWHSAQVAPNGAWAAWTLVPGELRSEPALAANADGRLELLAIGADRTVWQSRQLTPGGAWGPWSTLGGAPGSAPWLAAESDGRLVAFHVGTDRALHVAWQRARSGAWGPWCSLGGSFDLTAREAPSANGAQACEPSWAPPVEAEPPAPDGGQVQPGDAGVPPADAPAKRTGCSATGAPGALGLAALALLLTLRARGRPRRPLR